MRFSVHHETVYHYSAPVKLGDHLLRLTPRSEYIDGLAHEIVIDPLPAWRADELDREGSQITRLGFSGETTSLRILNRFSGMTRGTIPPGTADPPLPWPDTTMARYLGAGVDPAVARFARELADQTGQQSIAFLELLNRTLHQRINRHIRPSGNAQPAAETLARGQGACRDLSVLFMACCRSLGIPARFASGYQAWSEMLDGRRHLHAWPEVLLPGTGWRGYDPTHGRAVDGDHVALAVSPDQSGTMPIEGSFRGCDITSTMEYDVRIELD